MATATRNFRWVRNWYILRQRSNNFFGSQWIGGVALVIFAVIALILANMEATKEAYHHFLEIDFGFNFGDFLFSMSAEHWVNDALMVVFFFVIGLEIKREIIAGELSSIKHAALPVAAAAGGMVAPALMYSVLNTGTGFEAGWGIPMATDIAFAIGVLSLLGKKVPISLKVFLMALAIVDDLGAILVIAVFYTSTINFTMLGIGVLLLALMFLMNKRGVTVVFFYMVPGIFVWYTFLNSGIHATIAGVLIAMTIPTKPRFTKKYFSYKIRYFLEEFRFFDRDDRQVLSNPEQLSALMKTRFVATSAVSPAQRLEHALNPFVTFIVMPVFALANAGVDLSAVDISSVMTTTQGMGIYLGLVAGKPVGIFLLCWLTIKLKLAAMPENSTWASLFGVACLGGIGFTMSIFIDCLAFAGTPYIDSGKIAVLIASVSAAVLGAVVINLLSRNSR